MEGYGGAKVLSSWQLGSAAEEGAKDLTHRLYLHEPPKHAQKNVPLISWDGSQS